MGCKEWIPVGFHIHETLYTCRIWALITFFTASLPSHTWSIVANAFHQLEVHVSLS